MTAEQSVASNRNLAIGCHDKTVPPSREATESPASHQVTKITINLTAQALRALEEVTRSTGDNKTECINRGVRLYSWVQDHLDAGDKLCVVDPEGRTTEIRIF